MFGLDGVSYEIDASKRNAAAVRKTFERYIKAGGKSAPSRAASRRRAAPAPKAAEAKRTYDLTQLREWAGANGVAIPSRGRIPQAVVDQYRHAGGR